jgi:hypothetical protein
MIAAGSATSSRCSQPVGGCGAAGDDVGDALAALGPRGDVEGREPHRQPGDLLGDERRAEGGQAHGERDEQQPEGGAHAFSRR